MIRFFFVLTVFITLSIFISCSTQVENNKSITLIEVQENGLKLEIPDSSIELLLLARKEVIKSNLLTDKKSYVNADLSCGEKVLKVTVRFKGDHIDHLNGNRWSFRVKTKKEGLIFGEDKFSIQGVHTRAFLNEWLFHKLLKKEGLVYLQYHFIPFQIKNIDSLKGIYAYESHFKTNLLKIQNKKPGPIAKFSEDLFWDFKYRKGEPNRDSILMTESEIKLTGKKGYKESLKTILLKNLDNYRKGLIVADSVLDVKKWARFIAINGLMKSDHALRWHNLRFYLNPETQLIEPVGFDCVSWHSKKGAWFLDSNELEEFYKGLFDSELFLSTLNNKAHEIAERSYFKNFLDDNKEDIEKNIELIKLEKKEYRFWPIAFYKNQDLIKKSLDTSK